MIAHTTRLDSMVIKQTLKKEKSGRMKKFEDFYSFEVSVSFTRNFIYLFIFADVSDVFIAAPISVLKNAPSSGARIFRTSSPRLLWRFFSNQRKKMGFTALNRAKRSYAN